MSAAMPDPRRGREKAEARLRQGEPGHRRLAVAPAFRSTYNAITEAHRVVVVPRYFWVRWAPILGPVASGLYVQLRLRCYHNPETGETRDWCWPRQSTLAAAVGIKDTKTVRRALVRLEAHGFVTRESVYRRDGEATGVAGRARRCTDRYVVHFEIPLTEEDRAAALSAEPASDAAIMPPDPSAQAAANVDNSDGVGKFSRHTAREILPSRTSTRTSTSTNVGNVRSQAPSGRDPAHPRQHPWSGRSPRLSPEERDERESLAVYVGDQLAAMAGSWDPDGHRSAGFHRRIALRLDACHVHEALAAARDAMDAARGAGGGARRTRGEGRAGGAGGAARAGRERPDPAAYFAGAVRRIAEREGIDLGVRWSPRKAPAREEGTDRWAS